MMNSTQPLSHGDLLQLKRWNTPSVYNGWEQITKSKANIDGFNLEPVSDYMPNMGPMVGYAITVVIEPQKEQHPTNNPHAWSEYRKYVASVPGPKIVVVQDLDKPLLYGAFWGEVNSNVHRALGCVGTITDGGIRDVDEMNNAGFKALARSLCVGHAYSWPVRWNCGVNVFGRTVRPGQLIHADKHGFLVIPDEDQRELLDAVEFMDANECATVIAAARSAWNKNSFDVLGIIKQASDEFSRNVKNKFNRKGEW